MKRAVAAALLLLCLAGAAQAHWPDVRFRNLTATPESGLTYRFSVLMVNTAAEDNANNVSFQVSTGTAPAKEYCLQFVELKNFEKQALDCMATLPAPGRYTLVFQDQRLAFTAGEGGPPPTVQPSPPPSFVAPPPQKSPGFGVLGALAALGLLSLLGGKGRRETRR